MTSKFRTWTANPNSNFSKGPASGQKIKIVSWRPKFSSIDCIGTTEEIDVLDGVLMQLHVVVGNKQLPHGTAVMVAPGVALTSAHTFADHFHLDGSPAFRAQCLAPKRDGKVIGWEVLSLVINQELDTAILTLSLLSPAVDLEDNVGVWNFQIACITTRQPSIGERLTIVGFRSDEDEYEAGKHISANMAAVLAQGAITNFYPGGRDPILLPYPSIEIDCPAIGAMSGGPVFDAEGFLIGLLCRSMQTLDPKEGPAYAIWIVPLLPQKFEGGWPLKLADGSQGLISPLSRSEVDNRAAITVGETEWTYSGWL